MFVAMNRFKVAKGREADFEAVWTSRETYLHEMEGFGGFALLKGPQREDHTLYASHTTWASEAHFKAWTTSEQFRRAHARAGSSTGKGTDAPMYLGHPEFEGFTAVMEQDKTGQTRLRDAPRPAEAAA